MTTHTQPRDLTYLTPEQAPSRLCPLARAFGGAQAQTGCRGPDCMFWRWQPISAADPRVTQAIQDAMEKLLVAKPTVQKALLHKEAVAEIMEHPHAYSIPTEPEKGFCGAAGVPA